MHPSLASLAHKLLDPIAFMSSVQRNKTYTLKEVQQQPDFKEFVKVMENELKDHESSKRWEIVHKSAAQGRKVLKDVWSFKRNCNPDGSLDEHKACICPHGGMQ